MRREWFAACVVGPCVLRAKDFFLSSPIPLFYLLGNPVLIKKGKQPHISQKKCPCKARRMPTQQKHHKTVNTNNLCAVKRENEKPTFRAPINLFSVWVFNPVTWKIGWGKKKRKLQVVIEENDEIPSLEEMGRQDELKQLYCSLRKKKEKVTLNQSK